MLNDDHELTQKKQPDFPLDIRDLRCLVAVLDTGNITHAAAQLGTHQPPLSARLSRMEARLGFRLMIRSRGGVEPTAAGRALYADARRLLDGIDRALDRVRRIERGVAGQLVVGVTRSTIAHPRVRAAIAGRTTEDVELSIITDGSAELHAAVAEGRVDAAFTRPLRGARGPDRLHLDHIASEPMVAALPANGHPAIDAPLTLDDLARRPFVLYHASTDPVLDGTIRTAFHDRGLLLQVVQVAPSVDVALDLVATGLGATIVPGALRHRHAGEIDYREIAAAPDLNAEIVLATRTAETAPLVRSLRRDVVEGT